METLTVEQQQALALARARRRRAEAEAKAPVAEEPVQVEDTRPELQQRMTNLVGGAIRGAGSIGATLATPYDLAVGNTQSLGNPERRAEIDNSLRMFGVDPESMSYGVGKFGAELAGTAGIPIARAGGLLAKTGKNALSAGTAAGLVNPEDAPLGAAIGGAAVPVLGASKWAIEKGWNKVANPLLDLVRSKGHENVLGRYLRSGVGEANVPATITAARQVGVPQAGPGVYDVPNYPTTLAESMVGIPEGSPLARAQELTAMTKGGPSAEFGRIDKRRAIAIDAAEKARDSVTASMRNTALENANTVGTIGSKLSRKQQVLEDIATQRSEDVRRFASAGERAAERAHTTTGGAALTSVPGYPRQPGRYTYMGELVKKAEDVTDKAATSSLKIGEAARFNKYQLDSLSAHGYYPLTADSIQASIQAIKNKPGNKSNTTLQKAMSEISDTLRSVTDETGIVDANELYTIRKLEAGSVIEKYAKENATWDKKFTAGLLKDVEHAIDDAVEKSGGTGWKDYLREYAGRSKAIDAAKERTAEMYKPVQSTHMGGGLNVASETKIPIPNLLSRTAMAGSFALRRLGSKLEPRIDEFATEIMKDPRKYADLMERTPKELRFQLDKALRTANALAVLQAD